MFQHVIENHPLKKEDNTQKGGDAKLTSNNSVTQRFEKDGDVESTPKITTNKGGKKGLVIRKGALNDTVNQTNIFPAGSEQYDLLNFFTTTKSDVENELTTRREKVRDLKWYLNVRVEMVGDVNDGVKEKTTPHFRSKTYISLENDDNEHNLNEAFQKINAFLE